MLTIADFTVRSTGVDSSIAIRRLFLMTAIRRLPNSWLLSRWRAYSAPTRQQAPVSLAIGPMGPCVSVDALRCVHTTHTFPPSSKRETYVHLWRKGNPKFGDLVGTLRCQGNVQTDVSCDKSYVLTNNNLTYWKRKTKVKDKYCMHLTMKSTTLKIWVAYARIACQGVN